MICVGLYDSNAWLCRVCEVLGSRWALRLSGSVRAPGSLLQDSLENRLGGPGRFAIGIHEGICEEFPMG